jgi:predicted PurR-regulated permease PerM
MKIERVVPQPPPPPETPIMRPRQDDRRSRRAFVPLLGTLTVIAVLWALWAAQSILIPIVAAFFLSILLNPPVEWMSRVRIPRLFGAAVVLAGFLAVLGFGIVNLSSAAQGWADRLPEIADQMERKLSGIRSSLREASDAERALNELTEIAPGPKRQVVVMESPSLLWSAFTSSTKLLAGIGACLLLTLFLLAAGPRTFSSFIGALPRRAHRIWTRHYAASTQKAVAQYIRTLALVNIGVGVLLGTVLYALEFPNPVFFGVIIAALNALPYIGPALIAAILAAVGILSYDEPMQWLAPFGFFWLVHIVESNVVTPLLLGRRLSLNPIAVILMLMIWGWLWGVAGLILAVPLLIATKVVIDSTDAFAVLRPLFGSEPEKRLP